jgi:hypothetical protein
MLLLVKRTFVVAAFGALLLSACGGASLSLSEYSDEVATLIIRVDGRLDAHAERLAAGPPSVEATQAFFDDRVAGYHELVDGVDVLEPPEEVVELHMALQGILAALLTAEEARLEFANTVSSVEDLDQVWEGPEAQAVRAAELQAIELCYAAQGQVDATEDRAAFGDLPWIPSQLQEVVRVSFNCPE